MYLFDTDIIIHLLRATATAAMVERIARVPAHQQYLSAISLSELVYGASRSTRSAYHLGRIREILLTHVQIADFDTKAAYRAGSLRAELARNGTPLAFADVQIAAIALSLDLTLVTGNVRHFRRVADLRVENWLTD